MLGNKYIVIDLETTGLSYNECDIIEIGAIKIENDKIVDTFSEFINIGYPLPYQISTLTGITDEELKTGMDITDCLLKLKKFIEGIDLVGHNVNFDYSFLAFNMKKYLNYELTNEKYDTMYIAKKKVKTKNYKLATLLDYFKLSKVGHHRAINDVEMTWNLLKCLNQLPDIKAPSSRGYHVAINVNDYNVGKEKENSLTDKYICFTGDLNISRQEAMTMVGKCGGVNQNAVSQKTNYLVCGANTFTTTKYKKAVELKENNCEIEIIDEQKFLELVGE